MSDINILVDTSEVVGGQKALNDLANTFAKVVTKVTRDQKMLQKALEAPWAAQSAGIDAVAQQMNKTSTTAVRENQRIVASLLGINNGYKSAEDSARAFSVVLENQERSARQVAETINRLNNIGGPKATNNGASFSAMEGELERLTTKYNQVYAASKIYEKSLTELDRAHMLGVTSIKQHAAAVDQLNMEYQQFQAGTAVFGNRFAQQAGIASRSTNQLGVVVQQSGYQIGDFLVQVQSGTNWMVAFGQQATQLVGTLPLLAGTLGMSASRLIAISTGLGIVIPLLTAIGAAWMRTTEDQDKAAGSISNVEQKLKSLDATLEDWVLTMQAAAQGMTVDQFLSVENLDDANAKLAESLDLLKRLEEQSRFRQFDDGRYDLLAAIDMYYAPEGLIAAQEAYGSAVERVNNLRNKGFIEAANYVGDEIQQWRDKIELERLSVQYGEEHSFVWTKKIQLQKEAYAEELRSKGVGEQMIQILTAQMGKFEEMRRIANRAAEQAERIKTAINSLRDTAVTVSVNFKANFDGFSGKVGEWAEKTYGTMLSMAQGGEVMTSSPRPREAPQNVDFGIEDAGGGGGGGGGGSTTTIENKMEEIYKYLELEEYQIEQEQIAHKQREDILRTALENKMITLEEYNALEKAITEQHNQDLLEIEMRTKNSRLTELSGMFGQLAGIMQAGGSKTAKIAATFGAIEATINSYVAATDALRKATTIPGKIAAYASVLATGLKGVAAIKAAGGVGGGSGGGGGPSSSVTPSAADTGPPQTVYIDSLDPEGLYSGQTLINLFDAFYNENDKRGKVFVVARG